MTTVGELNTLAEQASERGDEEALLSYVKQGATNVTGCVYRCIIKGHTELVKTLFEKYKPFSIETTLSLACLHVNRELIDYAIENGAHNWNIALIYTVRGGNLDIVRLVSERATNIGFAMSEACRIGDEKIVDHLLTIPLPIDDYLRLDSIVHSLDNMSILRKVIHLGVFWHTIVYKSTDKPYEILQFVIGKIPRNDHVNLDDAVQKLVCNEEYYKIQILMEAGYSVYKFLQTMRDTTLLTGLLHLEKVRLIQRFWRNRTLRRQYRHRLKYRRVIIQLECRPVTGQGYKKSLERFQQLKRVRNIVQ